MCTTMKKFTLLVLCVVVLRATAKDIIYNLDPEDYYRMPMKNKLDRFDPCIGVSGGVYCTANADLVSDKPSQLLDMIQAYSANEMKNLNYSNIIYGVCITNRCKQFYDGDDSDQALWRTTEACLNDSLAREYDLKVRVTDLYCYHHGRGLEVDGLDIAVAAVVVAILALNAAGTIYDCCIRDPNEPGNGILMSFSLRVSVGRLAAPASTDPRHVALRSMNGIRVMTCMLVILGHVPVPSVATIDNPTWLEWTYRIVFYHILYQGHQIMITFFMMSGFLLAYNVEVQREKYRLDWRMLPKAIFVRWLRLSPVSMLVLALTATWFRHTGFGPFWWIVIGAEWRDCRQYWIYNALYINNWVDHSTCNLQTWSLAADMQMHIVGLAVVLVAPSVRWRRVAMALLYAVGVLLPAYYIYMWDMDGSLLATPTTIATFFVQNESFTHIYKRTVTNMPGFVIGMAFGYVVYDLQKKGLIRGEHKKYRLLYTAIPLLMFASVISAHALFLQDASRASLLTRLLYAPIVKPFFASLIVMLIVGAMYKVDDLIRGLLEWPGWVPLSRLSYCMFALHVVFVRYLGGTKNTLSHFSFFHMFQDFSGALLLTTIFAAILYLTVEVPFASLIKVFLSPPKPEESNKQTNGIKLANGHTVVHDKLTNGTANGHGNGILTNGISQTNGLSHVKRANGISLVNGNSSYEKHTNGISRANGRPIHNKQTDEISSANGHHNRFKRE